MLALRESEFVEAARAQGMGSLRIIFREVLPNVASTMVVFFPLLIANAILLEAALSFLGAGVQPPNSSWGTMIAEGVDRIVTAPHLAIVPGVMLVLDGALAEHLRRGRARRARPALAGEDRALMSRRWPASSSAAWLSMLLVLFAVSVIVFLIFNVLPERRPGAADGGQDPDRDPDRSDPRGVGLRRTALRPVR